jgi:hypothetical protein
MPTSSNSKPTHQVEHILHFYQLCEVGVRLSNCDTATATVIVSNPIDAVNDGPTTVATVQHQQRSKT